MEEQGPPQVTFSAPRGSTPPSCHSSQRDTAARKLADLGHKKKLVKEDLHRLRYTLSDSVLQGQKCQQRVEKQTMMVGYHDGRARAVSQQIRTLNTELKQQEGQGWDAFLQREERLVNNSRFRNVNSAASAFGSSHGSMGAVSPVAAGKNMLRASGPAARGTAAQMSSVAAAKLALPRTPGGTDGCMAVVEDVVKSRMVPSGPQLKAAAGSSVHSVASSSKKLTSSFAAHKPSKRNSPAGHDGGPGDSHSAAGGGTLLDWFEEQDKAKVLQEKRDSAGTLSSTDDNPQNDDNFDDEVEVMTATEASKDMAAECAEMKKQKHETGIKAQLDYEHRMAIAEQREYQMDCRAEQRRQVEERRIQCQDREEIREALLMKAGGAREAFDACDVVRSGKISLNELDGGLRSLDVRYKDFTTLTKILDVFKLFDHNKKGYITFADLFPLDARTGTDTERMSTPEFWKYWCNQNKDLAKGSLGSTARSSKWEPSSVEESLELLGKSRRAREEVIEKKKWMQGMIHRLKHKGKSDARCREICALHLPKGTGPRDLEDVNTFSQAEVHACRKKYTDKVQESVRKIEKTVFDMHDLKKKLHTSKQQLYACTEEPHVRQRAMEDARISMGGLAAGLGGAGLFNKSHAMDEDE